VQCTTTLSVRDKPQISEVKRHPNERHPYFMTGVGEGMGARGGFINIKDMYNNDVGKGGARVYEAYEVK
jgi:hypothetical protein